MPKKLLLIEDNQDIGHLLTKQLQQSQYECQHETNGLVGLKQAQTGAFDLLILDIMLPGIDGIQICQTLRESKINYLPILMLTAKNSEIDKVVGLEMGADDYLTKPFSIHELLARIKGLLRRVDAIHKDSHALKKATDLNTIIEANNLVINKTNRTLLRSQEDISLTAKEFDLLWHFASNPGRIYSRTQLLDQVWGHQYDGFDHTVNSHINRLRSKLELDPTNPQYIQTVWGVGYTFKAAP